MSKVMELFSKRATKISSILMLTMLLGLLTAKCGPGCLVCDEDGTTGSKMCSVCDIHNSYLKFADGSCVQRKVERCEVASLDRFVSRCLMCEPQYVLDSVLDKCVSVQFAFLVPDCYRYDLNSNCVLCTEDHFLLGKECLKTSKTVEHCARYKGEGECEFCATGYFLDEEVCKGFPQTKGCSQYSHTHCDECKAGYAKDLNFYMRTSISQNFVQNAAKGMISPAQIVDSASENCFSENVANCGEHRSPNRCKTCKDGYFVTAFGLCQKFPQNRIKQCVKYTSSTVCSECQSLFYLSGGKCIRRTEKEHCAQYKTLEDKCARCKEDYHLSIDNTCVERDYSDHKYEGCKVKHASANQCETCEDNHELLSTGVCFTKVQNCQTHQKLNTSGDAKKCTVCEDFYFLKDNNPSFMCTAYLHIPQCKDRVPHQNKCEECVSGFYVMSTGFCSPHSARFCDTFETKKNECKTCIKGFEKYTTHKKCLPSRVDNCDQISSTFGQCSKCLSGFYMTSGKQCEMYNLVGCLGPNPNKNECVTCDLGNGYYLNKDTKQCHLHSIAHCKEYNADDIGCKTCEDGFTFDPLSVTCIRNQNFDSECQTRNPSQICTNCKTDSTHYLEPISKRCIVRTNRQFCLTYLKDADLCSSCTTGNYYFSNGRCFETKIPHCNTPVTNKNECQTCNSGYFLDGNTKTCLLNHLEGCQDPSENSDFGCKTCKTKFVLNIRTKICEESYIPNCETYVAGKHECSACESQFFLGKDGNCYYYGKLGCLEQTTNNDDTCNKCLPGFYKNSDNYCEVVHVTNCKLYQMAGDQVQNACVTCHKGFYQESGKCKPQSLASCLTYTDNKNECSKCENLKKINTSSKVCEDIASIADCVESDGIADTCATCKQTKKMNGAGGCANITANDMSPKVANCLGNNSTNDKMCTKCSDGFLLTEIHRLFVENTTGCQQMKDSINFCDQCIPGFELNAATPGICNPIPSSYAGECIQSKLAVQKSMASLGANECYKCKNIETHYLLAGVCTPRTADNLALNCSEYNPNSDSCFKNTGGMSKFNPKTYTACAKNPGVVQIPNCAVYDMEEIRDGNVTKCFQCIPGYYGNKCDLRRSFISPMFDEDYQLNYEHLSSVHNNATFAFSSYRVNDGTFSRGMAFFNSDSQLLLGSPNHINSKYLMGAFNYSLNKYTFNTGSALAYYFDISNYAFYVNADSSELSVMNNNQCAFGYIYDQSLNFFGCVTCKYGLVGFAETLTRNRDGDINPINDYTVTSCATASDWGLSKQYEGIGYKGPDMWGDSFPASETLVGNFGDFFLYDTCDNGGVPIGFVFDTLNSDMNRYTPISPVIGGVKHPVMTCLKTIKSDLLISDCQVYVAKAPDGGVVDPAAITSANIMCLGCKPGHTYSPNGSPWPFTGKECVPIPGCDVDSSKNTWMNACGQCKKGLAWRFIPKTVNILYHECVEPNNEHCAIYNTEDEECFICKEGYVTDSKGVCVDHSNYDSKCVEAGYPMPNWKQPAAGYDNSKFYTKSMRAEVWSYMARTFGTRYATSSCSKCEKGYLPVRTTTGKFMVSDNINRTDNIENCETSNFSNSACLKCKDGYSKVDTKCKNNEEIGLSKECTAANGTATECSTCQERYYVNVFNKKECLKQAPGSLNENNLTNCALGYYLNEHKACEAIPREDDCMKYDTFSGKIQFKTCVICKDQNKVPLNYYSTKDYPGHSRKYYIESKCVEPTSTFDRHRFDLEMTTGQTSPLLINNLAIVMGGPDIYSLAYKKTYTEIKLASINNFPKFQCVKEFRQNLNCKNFETTATNTACVECKEGYVLTPEKSCIGGSIPHCLAFEDQLHCRKCKQGFFLATDETETTDVPFFLKGCKAYTVSCQEYDLENDSCLKCKSGSFRKIDTTNGRFECESHSVPNCAVYSPTTDVCRICEPGAYLDNAGVCHPINVVNCLIYSNSTGSCLACKNGFYLTNGTNFCKAHTILNCQIFSQLKDQCDLCSHNYYLDKTSGSCKQLTLDGCGSASQNTNQCLYCKNGYYLDSSTKKCKLNTSLYCQAMSIISNNCVTCVSTAYLDRNDPANLICKPYLSAKNCTHFDAFEDKCKGCQPGFYYQDATGACLEYSIPNCQSYKIDANECTACQNTFYLNSKVCQPVTAYSCLTFSLNENACSSCPPHHYKKASTGDCLPYSQEFCATYDPFDDKCVTCNGDSYLTIDRDCKPYTVQNCLNYVFNKDVCSTCMKGYYMDQTVQKCKPYTVANCDNFRLQEDSCSSCIPDHYLKLGKCSPYTQDNCATKDPRNDRCMTCMNNFYLEAGQCKPYTAENCLTHDSHKDLCTKCVFGHYFEFGLCFKYTANFCAKFKPNRDLCENCDFELAFPIYRDQFTLLCEKSTKMENCWKYSETEDKCTECSMNYYLGNDSSGKAICIHNPTGVANCETYLDQETCWKCEPDHFLRNNLCYEPDKLIVGCEYYSSEKYCRTCKSGYSLDAKYSCLQVVELSCKSHKDINNCASCLERQVLKLNQSSNMVCVDSGINNCALAKSSSDGAKCLRCDTGYFLEENTCHWPDSLVEKCQIYLGHGICGRCEDGHILSKKNNACTNNISDAGSQCLVGHLSLKPQCSRCDGGYYFNPSGACQNCSKTMAGCALCDIQNLTECKLCQKGYHMTNELVCREYEDPVPPTISAPIIRISFLMMIFLALAW